MDSAPFIPQQKTDGASSHFKQKAKMGIDKENSEPNLFKSTVKVMGSSSSGKPLTAMGAAASNTNRI